MKIFDRAIVKMTAVYSAILLALCVGFSISIYTIACREIDRERSFSLPSAIMGGGGREEIDVIIDQRNEETKQSLLGQIIIVNITIMALGVCTSYFLARWTLYPIHEAYRAQSRFVSDASHELRTPLTAIAMENEVLLRDTSTTKDDLKSQVKSNLEEVRKLQTLTDTLLQISRAEKLKPEDREAVVEQIIAILEDNAHKYSPKGGKVQVVRKKNIIKVIDEGPGIDEKDLPHIFERFYRADKSRSTEGYGLGLPLAKSLAEQIGAKITVENNPKKGATFSIVFSKQSDQSSIFNS